MKIIILLLSICLNLFTDCCACVFDSRVFLSGNPSYPNHVYYCENNNDTGLMDPTYFGMFNYFTDGVGASMITGLLPVANTLMVLRRIRVRGELYIIIALQTQVLIFLHVHTKESPVLREQVVLELVLISWMILFLYHAWDSRA